LAIRHLLSAIGYRLFAIGYSVQGRLAKISALRLLPQAVTYASNDGWNNDATLNH
jgi:hypothetical protein